MEQEPLVVTPEMVTWARRLNLSPMLIAKEYNRLVNLWLYGNHGFREKLPGKGISSMVCDILRHR